MSQGADRAKRVAVVGETVADAMVEPYDADRGVLPLGAYPGGSPANTAVGLGRLGTPTRFVGRLSGGALGGFLRAHVASAGVDMSASVTATQPASLAVTMLDGRGQASYEFYVTGAADYQWRPEELAAVPMDETCAVHTGSLALALDPGGPVIEEFLARIRPHATISIDPNLRPGLVPVELYRSRLDRWTALADLFKLSEDDLAYVLPGVGIEAACDRWHALGVRLAVVTRGGAGAVGSLDGARVTVPAPEVEIVDTVGAGDAFNAGLLHWLWRSDALGGRLDGLTVDGLRAAMTFAALVAARTCAVPGADPPWAAQLGDAMTRAPTG